MKPSQLGFRLQAAATSLLPFEEEATETQLVEGALV